MYTYPVIDRKSFRFKSIRGESNMKKIVTLILATVCSISFGAVHTWDFNSGADAAVSDTGVRLSGSIGSGVETKWIDAVSKGDAASGGTSGLGSVFLGKHGSDYLGPIQGFGRATDQVTLTLAFEQINMDGNPAGHTDFTIALTDSENVTTVGSNNNRHWIGLSTYDLFGNDRLVNAVKSYDADLTIDTSEDGVPSFGHAPDTSQNGRKSFNLLTTNGNLEWDGPLTLSLSLDFSDGSWSTTVNGNSQGFGTFDNTSSGITGIDGIQTRMANFDDGNENDLGDFVEISNMSLEIIPEPATIGLLGVVGSGLLIMRKRLNV